METPPIVFDLVNGKVLKVGQDPQARETYEQLLAAQREMAVSASATDRPR